MEPPRLFVLCVLLSLTHGGTGQVWEFGVDALGSIIVDYKKGEFSYFDKNKEIKLGTPHCYVMEYVRVQVQNPISCPSATYDKLSNVVKISYKPQEYSTSIFNIIGKAARKPGCFNQPLEMQLRHQFFK